MQLLQVPLSLLMGLMFGCTWGYITHFVPHEDDENLISMRVVLLTIGGLIAIFGSGAMGYKGAGPFACIVAAYVACLGWKTTEEAIECVSFTVTYFKFLYISIFLQ